MGVQSPAGPLIHEHRVIERVIAAMDRRIAEFEKTRSVDPVFIDSVVDFIRTYADRCHHGKEEDILFRDLATKPLSEPLARMMFDLTEEHVFARATTRRLVEANERWVAGDRSASDEIADAGRTLVGFYPVHIEKEDRQFFKPALEYLTDDELAHMLAEFHEFDRQLIHEKYLGVADRLESWGS